jgi:RNA polymerase sporulation-specific sigma factor
MFENLSAREMRAQLMSYITDALNGRETEIIVMRYGLNNTSPKTQREVAAMRGISRSYVSRIEKKALEKLRRCFEE